MVSAPHIGRLLIAAFAAMTALKEVVSGSLVRNHDPLLLVFVAFACTTALFAALRWRSEVSSVRLGDRVGTVVALNVATLMGWGTVYFALLYLAPAVVSTLAVATLPLFSTLLFRLLSGPQVTGKLDAAAAILIACAAFWLSFTAWQGGGLVFQPTPQQLALAFGACVLSGLGMAASNIIAARLYSAGWQPGDVLARRFILLMLVAGWLWLAQEDTARTVTLPHFALLVVYGLGAIAFPLFILQVGLKKSSPVEAGAIISLSPMMVLVFQAFDPQVRIAPTVTLCIALTVAVVVGHILLRDTILRAAERVKEGTA